jgi:hypothetical protein
MSTSGTQSFQVLFPNWYDERGKWEANEKGWLQGVEVRFANGDVLGPEFEPSWISKEEFEAIWIRKVSPN